MNPMGGMNPYHALQAVGAAMNNGSMGLQMPMQSPRTLGNGNGWAASDQRWAGGNGGRGAIEFDNRQYHERDRRDRPRSTDGSQTSLFDEVA